MLTAMQQSHHPPSQGGGGGSSSSSSGGSILGVAREKDEGALRALCQACSASGEVTDFKKACVLVTIYRRESDLFALLLRERHDGTPGGRGGASGPPNAAAGTTTVLCDMALDDGVHLEPHQTSGPLVVKIVNTCHQKNSAYLLEFGRLVDLTTFQQAFAAARGYFRQMLTLRTLVADSFWQGFASGAEAPVRNEPHAPTEEALKPPPGVVPGQREAGLRGKTHGPGALGLDAEALAAQIAGLWPSTSAAGEGGSAAGVGNGASSPRARSPAGPKSTSSTASSRGGKAAGGAAVQRRKWPGSAARGAVERAANLAFNSAVYQQRPANCHRCQHDRPGPRYRCPDNLNHVNCVRCLTNSFSIEASELLNGHKRYYCPQCASICPCPKCEEKSKDSSSSSSSSSNNNNNNNNTTTTNKGVVPRKQAKGAGGSGVGEDETAKVETAKVETASSLIQYLPAPQLTHYEGLFAKYMQSLPALERVSTTEDVCFLCKEGGNLVECDEGTSWSRRVKSKRESLGKPPLLPGTAFSCLGVPMEEEGQGEEGEGEGGSDAKGTDGGKLVNRKGKGKKAQQPRCKKVYHAYCMGFNVADDELSSCPRHACVDCAAVATYFCRFCPASLCDEHFRTDPSGIVAETFDSLQHRVRRPFPRTRGGGFGPGKAGGGGAAGVAGYGKGSSRGKGGGRGSRGRGRGSGGRGSRGGGRKSVGGEPAGETIAQRRPKRGQVTVAVPESRGSGGASGGSSSGGGGGGGGSGGSGGGDKRSRGVGEPGGGAGCGDHDFVCTGCKMATRRAVRQYGLMGALETGGVVLPHGESEGSGDESESDVIPVTAPPPRNAAGVGSNTEDGACAAGGDGVNGGGGDGLGGGGGGSGGTRGAGGGEGKGEGDIEVPANASSSVGTGAEVAQIARTGNSSSNGVSNATNNGSDTGVGGGVGGGSDAAEPVAASAAAAAAPATDTPAVVAAVASMAANNAAAVAAAGVAADKYFSMFSRRDPLPVDTERPGGRGSAGGAAGSPEAYGGLGQNGGDGEDVEMG